MLNMQNSLVIRLLRISTFLLFLGRAWEHIYWEGPYRNVFYNPHGFGKVLEWLTGSTLQEIYRDHYYERLIDDFSIGVGVVFLLAAVSVLFYRRTNTLLKWGVLLGVVCLGLTFYGYFVGKHYWYGTLFEQSAQFFTPLLFLWYCSGRNDARALLIAKIAISITFICHGLFAIGYYPQPGNFADMMIIGFGMNEDVAREALVDIAWLDFVFAGFVLLPFNMFYGKEVWKKILRVFFIFLVGYAIVWGFMTALARIYTHFDTRFLWQSFEGFFHQFLVRIPHGVLPLIILYSFLRKK